MSQKVSMKSFKSRKPPWRTTVSRRTTDRVHMHGHHAQSCTQPCIAMGCDFSYSTVVLDHMADRAAF